MTKKKEGLFWLFFTKERKIIIILKFLLTFYA